jgi:hypothetical protein
VDGIECRIALMGEPVPWADHLADVASESPIPHLIAEFNRNVIFEFDGEIRDAACRVECSVWQDAISGAGLDAACACAAMVGDERQIRFEFEIEQDFRYKKIRTNLGVDKAGIFADPSDARLLRKIAFEDWAGVCVVAVLYRTPQDAVAYRQLLDAVERAEILLAVQEGLEEVARGEGFELEEAD